MNCLSAPLTAAYACAALWSLNFSIPLGRAWSNYRLTTDQDGRTTQQLGVSGTLLEERNLNYNVQEGYSSNGTGNSGNASMGYQGGSGDIGKTRDFPQTGEQNATLCSLIKGRIAAFFLSLQYINILSIG